MKEVAWISVIWFKGRELKEDWGELRFPEGCQPSDLSVWSWLGNGPLEAAADNLIHRQSCQMHEVVRRDDAVELTVHQPLPLYSYALVWTPLDRVDRLDAVRSAGRPATARHAKRAS